METSHLCRLLSTGTERENFEVGIHCLHACYLKRKRRNDQNLDKRFFHDVSRALQIFMETGLVTIGEVN